MTELILDLETIKVLSVNTRLDVLKQLAQRRKTATEISKSLNKHVTTIRTHLEILEKAELINKIDDNHKWIYFQLTKKGLMLVKPKPMASMKFMLMVSTTLVGYAFLGMYTLFLNNQFQNLLIMKTTNSIAEIAPAKDIVIDVTKNIASEAGTKSSIAQPIIFDLLLFVSTIIALFFGSVIIGYIISHKRIIK